MKLLRFTKLAAVNLAVLLAGLLLLELIFGGWLGRDPLTLLNPPRNGVWKFEWIHPGQSGAPEFSIYSRDRYGLRGDYGDPEDIDLLVVGGSTTDQKYITDGKTWTDLLQKRFSKNGKDVRVANAGVSGRTTYGHIHDFDGWFSKIPGLSPDYYLYFTGINDMFFDAGNVDNDAQWKADDLNLKETIKHKSALYKVYRTTVGVYLAKKFSLTHSWIDYTEAEWTDTPYKSDYSAVLAPRLDNYRERLHVIAGQVKGRNSNVVFMTQKRGDYRIENGVELGMVNTNSHSSQFFQDSRMGQLGPNTANGLDYQLILGEFNKVLMEVCSEVNGICLDLSRDVQFEIGDFYDHVHNTEAGAEKIADYLYSRLSDVIN